MKRMILKVAASGLALAVPAGGISLVSLAAPAAASQPARSGDARAAALFERAGRAVADNRLADAVRLLEEAVEIAPRDAGYRMMLADAYMRSGRFVSAAAAYGDVLTLDPARPRAGLTRALMHVATGRQQEAMAQLDSLEGAAPAADLGLAYAIAGAPQRAVELLEPAARLPGATARVRQNLALAYAFGGDWERARTIAEQDVSPDQVAPRLAEWAALAPRAGTPEPVAALLGVQPVADQGQPIRIALNQPATTQPPVRFAEAAPVQPAPVREVQAPAPAPAAAPVVVVASAEPVTVVVETPAAPAPAPAPIPAVVAAPVVPEPVPAPVAAPQPAVAYAAADPAPVIVPAPVALPVAAEEAGEPEAPEWGIDDAGKVDLPSRAAPAERLPVQVRYAEAAQNLVRADPVIMPVASRAARAVAPLARRAFSTAPLPGTRSANGAFVVQLGAFSSAGNAENAWKQYEERFGLRAEKPVTMTIDHQGRLLHRVAISGFARRGEASQVCRVIQARGGDCFVRSTAGDASIDWAARYGRRA